MKIKKKMPRTFSELMCMIFGHDWQSYPFYTGCYMEQAGECRRCGLDTHRERVVGDGR